MKNWKAALAVLFLALCLTACSDKNDENNDKSVNETKTPDLNETLGPGETWDDDEEFIMPPETEYKGTVLNPDTITLSETATELFVDGENPTFDEANNTVIFVVNEEITYDKDARISVAISGDDILLPEAEIVSDNYPSLRTENGYRGAAIKLSDKLEPGEYWFSINFAIYTLAFKCTVQ